MEALKPCPFCGRPQGIQYEVDEAWWVACVLCYARGPMKHSAEDAVAAWNNRAGEARLTAERDEMAAAGRTVVEATDQMREEWEETETHFIAERDAIAEALDSWTEDPHDGTPIPLATAAKNASEMALFYAKKDVAATREIARLTAERDAYRADAQRWQSVRAEVLRLDALARGPGPGMVDDDIEPIVLRVLRSVAKARWHTDPPAKYREVLAQTRTGHFVVAFWLGHEGWDGGIDVIRWQYINPPEESP